jgi:pimeloyl-ACP methyl ester carboxylesterase
MMRKKTPPSAGYSQAAKTVLQEGTSRVQEMHRAIAGHSFQLLKSIPLVNGPAQLVQQAHDAIAGGVYAAIRQGGGGLLEIAGAIEKHVTTAGTDTPHSPPEPPNRLASAVRSALNAAFGDHLADTHSVLAIQMGLYVGGSPVALEPAALSRAYPNVGQRLCLFIHGLGFNERCWENRQSKGDDRIDMPNQLAADTDYTILTLRYNSGLPIADNGAQLSDLLGELIQVWPGSVRELVLVGHSMGGLLAHSACSQALGHGNDWPARTRMVICLGSPHLGSPLERLGQLTTSALRLSTVTEPLARVAASRSQGIQDLRHGLAQPTPEAANIAWRFIGGSLTEDPDNPLSEIIGDGLVTLGSATSHDPSGDRQSIRLGGLGHMELLSDARVYAQIRAWLA